MTKKIFQFTLLVLVTFLLNLSCKKEVQNIVELEPEFEYYWNKFVEEAEARYLDLRVDTMNFSITFGELSGSIAGECGSIPGGDIIIDQESWLELDTFVREHLIFHELGHCVLGRHHPYDGVNGELNNLRMFECETLMTAGLDGFGCGIDYHSEKWREFYIDELFNITTVPDWIDLGTNLNNTIFTNEIFNISNLNSFETTILFDSILREDFLLKLDIVGSKDFTFTKNNLQFIFDSSFGKTEILENGITVYELGAVVNWERLNEEDGITNFSYQHDSGIDYFYIEETLLHSRNGISTYDKIQFEFTESVENQLKILVE